MVIELTYNLFIILYGLVINFLSTFNPKAKLWKEGRNELFVHLVKNDFKSNKWIWVHCASLGEFEQGRPVIESLRLNSNRKILLTFFSPSGYEKRKNYKSVDLVCYMPLDTKENASKFINIIQPEIAIFIRYEFWVNHINELYRKKIPVYLISASFRTKQLFFKPIIGYWFRNALSRYSKIFTIDEASKLLLNKYGIHNVVKSGDTRADRVIKIVEENQDFEKIKSFKLQSKLVICGSVWLSDVKILIESIKKTTSNDSIKWILAPHEVDEKHLKIIENELAKYNIGSSRYTHEKQTNVKVLIINNIGILAKIYKYADLVYVGGGFGQGIHNVLEPAIFGNIVIFGSKYKKFPEAEGLIENGAAFSVSKSRTCFGLIDYYLNHEDERNLLSKRAIEYINGISGATDAIVKEIKNKLEIKI